MYCIYDIVLYYVVMYTLCIEYFNYEWVLRMDFMIMFCYEQIVTCDDATFLFLFRFHGYVTIIDLLCSNHAYLFWIMFELWDAFASTNS